MPQFEGEHVLVRYLKLSGTSIGDLDSTWISYLTALDSVRSVYPEVAESIVKEFRDQRQNLKLIASENFSSLNVQLAMGNLLTDKYAEGAPGKRFYAGCDNVDDIERRACSAAAKLFGTEHAYVQPHSGADANLVAFLAALQTRIGGSVLARKGVSTALGLSGGDWAALRNEYRNQKMVAMDLAAGGHLTHGYRLNVSAQLFDIVPYGVDAASGLIDYDRLRDQAMTVRPFILMAGYSAYPRLIEFSALRQIADDCGAILIADIAHFAGMVAGGVFTGKYSPIGYADIVTSTTHKTLRGPRGGLVLATAEFAPQVDKGCPSVLGGPLPHVMAAKAICFEEALKPSFRTYASTIVDNAKALSAELTSAGVEVVSGGTDNHLVLVDVRPLGLTGRQAESALRACQITLNRNMIPGDENGPWYTGGLRLGTPALTTLGMGLAEMKHVADTVASVLKKTEAAPSLKGNIRVGFRTDESVVAEAKSAVNELGRDFPLYPELDLEFLEAEFLL